MDEQPIKMEEEPVQTVQEQSDSSKSTDQPSTSRRATTRIRRPPRLLSPEVDMRLPRLKNGNIKSCHTWRKVASSMPTLEKMDYPPRRSNSTESKKDPKSPAGMVWRWTEHRLGQPPVGKWMHEHEDEEEEELIVDDGNDGEYVLLTPAEKWRLRAIYRQRLMREERKRRKMILSTPLVVNGQINQELMHLANEREEGQYRNQKVDHNEMIKGEDLMEENEMNVEHEELVEIDEESAHSSTNQWVTVYEEAPPPPEPEAYDRKSEMYDPIAVSAANRAMKAQRRLEREQRKKEEKDMRERERAERELRLEEGKKIIEAEKKQKAEQDAKVKEELLIKRANRARYMKRQRYLKKQAMGAKEYEEFLKNEREKRRMREEKRMRNDPEYANYRRIRSTIKSREYRMKKTEIRFIDSNDHDLSRDGEEEEEEVYEDGVYDMNDQSQHQHPVLNDSRILSDEDVEVEKW